MDGTRFDDFTRALAAESSRRRFFKLLGGALGGGVALGALGGGALAKETKSGPALCQDYCQGQGLQGRDFGQCVSACAQAGGPPASPPPGTCPYEGGGALENEPCDPATENPCCNDPDGCGLSPCLQCLDYYEFGEFVCVYPN